VSTRSLADGVCVCVCVCVQIQARELENQLVTLDQQVNATHAEIKSVDKQLVEKRQKLEALTNIKARHEKEVSKLNNLLTLKKTQLNSMKRAPMGQSADTVKKRMAKMNAERLQALWQYHDINKQLVRNQLQMDPLVLTVAHAEMHIDRFRQQLRNLEEASGQLLVSYSVFVPCPPPLRSLFRRAATSAQHHQRADACWMRGWAVLASQGTPKSHNRSGDASVCVCVCVCRLLSSRRETPLPPAVRSLPRRAGAIAAAGRHSQVGQGGGHQR
jgi:hypothetical protein